MSISAEVKEISTERERALKKLSIWRQMVEVKKWQWQIKTRTAVYEAEIEELREHAKQSKVVHVLTQPSEIAQAKRAQEAEYCVALYKEQLKRNHNETYRSKIESIEGYRFAVTYEQFNPGSGAPAFSCPTCRKLVKHRPVEGEKKKAVCQNIAFSKRDIILEGSDLDSMHGRVYGTDIFYIKSRSCLVSGTKKVYEMDGK
ncbi:hypothetical protein ARMGADRAFT_1037672 [Armillaria gallica]|uniref:Uncharacterized protein n=1 Tax=Armillaria gallica TaxID=47427 RepID=A0A2H3CWV5_ARMGA|nr:hypothetical protein ARMGADRAFT_1037672 [Armillaria gallica]